MLTLASLPITVTAIIPQFDFGDAPAPYPTTLKDDGARHAIGAGLRMGQFVDAEGDGNPNATATGDDTTPVGAGNDEDGVTFLTSPMKPGSAAQVRVVVSENGRLDAWVDFGRDGVWDNRTDKIFDALALTPGTNTLTFTVPTGTPTGTTYARFRYSSQGSPLPTGAAQNGEVEDYQVTIGELDFGDAPRSYPTLLANNGARHVILGGFFLGKRVDGEANGQPSTLANGDDVNPSALPSDEDGVRFLTLPLVAGGTAQIEVDCSLPGKLDAWIDFNADGDWDDTGEQIIGAANLVSGTTPLSFTVPATATITTNTYARFRLSLNGKLGPAGPAPEGEVEDYRISIAQALDFGDAPDSYKTLLASDGARHRPSSIFFLGALVDVEADGQPTAGADGDDLHPSSTSDDEDGVVFTSPLAPGASASLIVTANISGRLDAWVDFGLDGTFAQTSDQVFSNTPLVAGPNTLTFFVPSNAKEGPTYARFRFSRSGSLPYFGLATDGEVEDYRVAIQQLFDFGDAPDPSYPTLLANDGARHRRNTDVFMGFRIDVEPDGQPSADANGDDNSPAGAGDDEDGVNFVTPVAAGEVVTVEVRVSTTGRLNAWLDFGGDGSWAEPGDQIFRDQSVVSGINTLTFDVPPDAKLGRTAARFRYNLQGGLTYTGFAADGEVEDYLVAIVPKPVAFERTNKGRDFWLTFPGNYAPDPDNPLRLRLGIVGPRNTAGTVEIPGLGWATNFVIGGAQRFIINLPKEAELGDANDEILKNGIHVTASAEVAVFGLNRVLYTTDGYLGLPSDVLGKEYIIQAYGNVHDDAPPLNGTQFGLVACEDATKVTIVPSAKAAGHAKGMAYTITLNRGETYQLRGTNAAPTDLSGTFVVGDKPIAVFGSHQCANLPDDTVWFCDYIVEQILPEERAASSFVAMPLATRTGGDTYRFFAVQDKTSVFLNGVLIATLDRGQFHQRKVVGPAYIAAENPIHVVQYANSSDFDLVTNSDPFQVVIPPIEMFRTEYEIWVPETGPYPANYINVVVPSGGVGLVRVDGVPIPAGSYVPISVSGFHGAQFPITTVGAHFLDAGGATGGKFPFGVIVYGWDVYDSYGYPGGMFFKDKTPPTLICAVTSTNVFVSPNFNCQGQVPDVTQGVIVADNCPLSPEQNIFQQPFPGTIVGVGTHIIRVYSTDAEGNLGFCEVTLNVLDAGRPVLQCPIEIIANCRTNNGANVGYKVSAVTTCGNPVPVTCTPPSGSFFPAGTTNVTCVAINAVGLADTCAFPVTVRCLSTTRTNTPGSLTIAWTGGGTLQTATQLTGAAAWIDLTQALSPFTVSPTNQVRFFRIKY